MSDRIGLAVLVILGVAELLSLGGIIWLASANPARPIPDVLVATPPSIVALLAGILVPRSGDSRPRSGPE